MARHKILFVMPPEAPVRSGVLKRADNVKSGRG
jgi:hypothetical protein